MRLDWQDFAVFVFFAAVYLAIEQKYQLLLLGAALILLGPFLVMERFFIPVAKKFPKLSVVLGIASITAGGWCWMQAFKAF